MSCACLRSCAAWWHDTWWHDTHMNADPMLSLIHAPLPHLTCANLLSPSLPPPLCRYAVIHNCWEGDANKRPPFNMLGDKIGCLAKTPEAEYVWQENLSSHDFHVTPILFVCFSVLHLLLQHCLCVLPIVFLTAVILYQPLNSACCISVSNLRTYMYACIIITVPFCPIYSCCDPADVTTYTMYL